MERDVRYLLVGIAVAALLAAFVGVVLWQARQFTDRSGRHYTVVVDGAVSGLNQGSIVRYLGVRAGRVVDLRLSPEDAGRVEVEIVVRPDIPVSRATRARIQPQGITGESYVALRTPEPGAGTPEQPDWARHPIIVAEPSSIDAILERLPRLVERLAGIAERGNRLLSDANLESVATILADAERFTGRLDGATGELERVATEGRRTLKQTRQTLASIEASTQEVGPTLREARGAAEEIAGAARQMGAAGERLDRQIERSGDDIQRFAEQGLPEATALLRDLRRTAATLERLGRSLERNPAQLIHRPPEGGMAVPP